MKPEDFWNIEPQYKAEYDAFCGIGSRTARDRSVAFVAIARNAMPFISNTLSLVDETAGRFRERRLYVFENDSEDGTDKALDEFAASRDWVSVEHASLGRDDMRGFQPERTIALAEYRNRCRLWVEQNCQGADFVIVLDMDPHGGFSPDGVMNSVGWISEYMSRTQAPGIVGGMGSNSICILKSEEGASVVQFDGYAARLNHWEDRRDKPGQNRWFHSLLPPVGSEPIPMNSCFGGVAVYRKDAYLAGNYAGGDCEHVAFHKSMRRAGYRMYLNPGCRYVAIIE